MRLSRLLLLLLWISPGLARADDTHHQDYPIGGRSLGLGGAFTALSDDPSGIFYNPAGIVDITSSAIQVSTNLYGLELSDGFLGAIDRVADLDTVVSELSIIPSGGGGVNVLNRGVDGRPKTVIGLGAFVPSYRSLLRQNLSSLEAGAAPSGCRTLAYRRDLLDRTVHAIAALGRRVTPRLSFGLSATAAYRSMRDTEETSCFGAADLDDGEASSNFSSAETNLKLTVVGLMLSFGAKLQVADRWFLGAKLTSPSVRVYNFADLRVQRGTANTEGRAFSIQEFDGLTADTDFGGELRLGAAYVAQSRLTAILDLSLHSGADYTLFRLPTSADSDLTQAVTLVRKVHRNWVLNANLGAEVHLWPSITLAGGLFTNFSSAREIGGALGSGQSADMLPHINTYGSSLVLGYIGDYTITRIGGTMSYGEGTDVVPVYEGLAALGSAPEYVKVKMSQLFTFFFISSTFRY